MRGLLLVSNKNQVVIATGDHKFKTHLKERIQKEVHCHNEEASTSSGIFSDAEGGDNQDVHKECSSNKKRNRDYMATLSEVTHLFLPLISMYRSSAAIHDSFETVFSNKASILFGDLNSGFLLLVICERKSRIAQSWLRAATSALNLHFGPLLETLDSDFSVCDSAVAHLECALNAITQSVPDHSVFSDGHGCRTAAFYFNETKRMLPLLKSLCERVLDIIGNNRYALPFSCLLVSQGHVLCSVNSTSDEKKIWKHIHNDDLGALQRFLELHPLAANTESCQFWLRSKNGIPFYADVMRFTVLEGLEVVFIAAASHCNLIRIGADALQRLEYLIYEDSETEDTATTIKLLCSTLRATKARSHSRTPTAFLRNPEKTADFLENVWNRILAEVKNTLKASAKETGSNRSRTLSLLSMRSAMSMLSMSQSLDTYSGRDKLLPVKLDTMVRYLRRQVVSLMLELCSSAQADALSERVPGIHAALARSLTRTHLMSIHKLGFGTEEKVRMLETYLRPTTWRLDMLAYEFLDNNSGMRLSYLPDVFHNVFIQFPDTTSISSIDLTVQSKSYYAVQIQLEDKNQRGGSFLFGRGKSDHSHGGASFTLRALYFNFVHRQLAQKQTMQLAAELKQISQRLHILYS